MRFCFGSFGNVCVFGYGIKGDSFYDGVVGEEVFDLDKVEIGRDEDEGVVGVFGIVFGEKRYDGFGEVVEMGVWVGGDGGGVEVVECLVSFDREILDCVGVFLLEMDFVGLVVIVGMYEFGQFGGVEG